MWYKMFACRRISVRGSTYRLNSDGDNVDPSGTPIELGHGGDNAWFTKNLCVLFWRKDLNHFSTVPDIPILFSIRASSFPRLTVSNAEDRSSRTIRHVSSWSSACRASSTICKIAVSLLCPGLNPDWQSSNKLKLVMWLLSCCCTHFSSCLASNRILVTGWKLFGSAGSPVGFLMMGRTCPV